MWSTIQRRFSGRLASAAVVCAVLLSAAASTSAAHGSHVSHRRARTAMSAPAAAGSESPAELIKRQTELLAGLQASQSALENQTANLHSLMRREISELRTELADSRAQSMHLLEQTNRGVDSIRNWLKSAVLFFILSLSGVLYFFFRRSVQESPLKRKGKIPASNLPEEEMPRWQSGEPGDAAGRPLGIRKESIQPSAR